MPQGAAPFRSGGSAPGVMQGRPAVRQPLGRRAARQPDKLSVNGKMTGTQISLAFIAVLPRRVEYQRFDDRRRFSLAQLHDRDPIGESEEATIVPNSRTFAGRRPTR